MLAIVENLLGKRKMSETCSHYTESPCIARTENSSSSRHPRVAGHNSHRKIHKAFPYHPIPATPVMPEYRAPNYSYPQPLKYQSQDSQPPPSKDSLLGHFAKTKSIDPLQKYLPQYKMKKPTMPDIKPYEGRHKGQMPVVERGVDLDEVMKELDDLIDTDLVQKSATMMVPEEEEEEQVEREEQPPAQQELKLLTSPDVPITKTPTQSKAQLPHGLAPHQSSALTPLLTSLPPPLPTPPRTPTHPLPSLPLDYLLTHPPSPLDDDPLLSLPGHNKSTVLSIRYRHKLRVKEVVREEERRAKERLGKGGVASSGSGSGSVVSAGEKATPKGKVKIKIGSDWRATCVYLHKWLDGWTPEGSYRGILLIGSSYSGKATIVKHLCSSLGIQVRDPPSQVILSHHPLSKDTRIRSSFPKLVYLYRDVCYANLQRLLQLPVPVIVTAVPSRFSLPSDSRLLTIRSSCSSLQPQKALLYDKPELQTSIKGDKKDRSVGKDFVSAAQDILTRSVRKSLTLHELVSLVRINDNLVPKLIYNTISADIEIADVQLKEKALKKLSKAMELKAKIDSNPDLEILRDDPLFLLMLGPYSATLVDANYGSNIVTNLPDKNHSS